MAGIVQLKPSPAHGSDSATEGNVPIRHAYIQSLTDCLHACLLRGDLERARRAWAILIRCREVDWRSRWQWGLLFLSTATDAQSTLASTSASQAVDEVRQVERWINTLRMSANAEDKPSLLHALILYLIKHERYRQALETLETYLTSYPYVLSASLHTYAGLLAFYLAQPASSIRQPSPLPQHHTGPSAEDDAGSPSARSSPSLEPNMAPEGWSQADQSLMRQARGWFAKALEIDEKEEVAIEFIRMIDHPTQQATQSDSDEEMKSSVNEGSEGSAEKFDFSDEDDSS